MQENVTCVLIIIWGIQPEIVLYLFLIWMLSDKKDCLLQVDKLQQADAQREEEKQDQPPPSMMSTFVQLCCP